MAEYLRTWAKIHGRTVSGLEEQRYVTLTVIVRTCDTDSRRLWARALRRIPVNVVEVESFGEGYETAFAVQGTEFDVGQLVALPYVRICEGYATSQRTGKGGTVWGQAAPYRGSDNASQGQGGFVHVRPDGRRIVVGGYRNPGPKPQKFTRPQLPAELAAESTRYAEPARKSAPQGKPLQAECRFTDGPFAHTEGPGLGQIGNVVIS